MNSPCTKCGSSNTEPLGVKPPPARQKGKQGQTAHTCSRACIQVVVFCLDCRFAR